MMLQHQFRLDYVPLRERFDATRGDRLITISSVRKRMSVVLVNGVPKKNQIGVIYTKGAAEIMLELSTKYINSDKEVALDAATRSQINASISKMTKGALRCVALAHRSLDRITGQEA